MPENESIRYYAPPISSIHEIRIVKVRIRNDMGDGRLQVKQVDGAKLVFITNAKYLYLQPKAAVKALDQSTRKYIARVHETLDNEKGKWLCQKTAAQS
jgi:hypothetical protein